MFIPGNGEDPRSPRVDEVQRPQVKKHGRFRKMGSSASQRNNKAGNVRELGPHPEG